VASDPVLVHRPAVSLPASFPRLVALPQLRFASIGMVSFRRDFHPQDSAHAGRTTGDGHRLQPMPVWVKPPDPKILGALAFCFFIPSGLGGTTSQPEVSRG